MTEIKLTNSNLLALVDDEDSRYVDYLNWYLVGKGYAQTSREGQHMYLQQVIMPHDKKGFETDHINGNKLDNQKHNLRVISISQNRANKNKQKNNTSGYKGVTYNRARGLWQAQIQKDRRMFYLGGFSNVIDAAKAYDKAAISYFGNCAKVNFI